MRQHEQIAAKGFDRLARLEAEVLGDELTKRPSLREDLGQRLSKIYKLGWGVLTAMIVKMALDWFSIAHR